MLIATDAGYEPIVRAANELQTTSLLLVLFGVEDSFPFKPRPSTILVSGMPAGIIACVPQLDEFGIASRLASTAGLPGCYDGTVVELAEIWLQSLEQSMRLQIEIVVSGSAATVGAVVAMAGRLDVRALTLPSS